MKKSSKFLPLLATGLLAVGCQDYDAGFTEADIKTKQYADKFVQEFGQVDPNQDWSMATLVEANVNLPELQGTAKMNIMTGDPRLSSTRLLAQIMLQDGKGQIQFDAIKGNNNVFVTVEQDGQYKVFGQYTLVNGKLGVGDVADFLAAPAGLTRAFSASCPTTQSTTGNYLVDAEWATYQVVTGTAIKYNQQEKSYDQWVIDTKAFVTEQNSTQYYPFTDESVRHFVISSVDFENSTWVEKDDVTKNTDELIKWNANGASVSKTADDWKTYVENQTDAYSYWNNNGNYPYTRESIVKFKNPAEQWHDAYYDWSSPVLKDGCTTVPVGSLMTYNSTTKTLQEWKDEALANSAAIMAGTYDGPFELSSFVINTEDCPAGTTGAIYLGTYPVENWVRKDDAVDVSTYGTEHVQVQYLNGVEKSPAESWDAMLGNSFFGANAFFAEGTEYYSSGKLGKYYQESELPKMEAGYQIHTDGPTTIELPYIFGCTAYANQFGYVYWSDAEAADPDFNPLALKHFVLIEDARPATNITYTDNQTSTSTAVTGSEFAKDRWPSLVSMERQYVGTTYRPMFFGANRNTSTGDYQFPAGYNIVFFISTLTRNGEVEQSKIESGEAEDPGKYLFTDHNPHGVFKSFNYSDPNLNKMLIDHQITKRTGEANGMVKCVTWTHDGNTYMGFGDNSGDEDLNDIVFLVHASGQITTNEQIVVAPIKWHKNYDGKHHDGVEVPEKDDDLYAINSLNIGANYTQPATDPTRDGYTFLGWATSPNGTPSKTINETVADENGACYFAIWEPEGESVTIKWHKNYNGSHDTTDDDLFAKNIIAKSTGTYSKPSTTPTAPEGKVFKGWAKDPNATEVLSDEELTNQTTDEDVCYFAIYEDAPAPTPDPEYISWMFACEDLGGTFDYDFNDVVWEVQKTKVGEDVTAVKVRLLAAGGTLPFTLSYNSNKICTKEEAFGTSTTPVNAGPRTVSKDVKEYTVSGIGSDWTVSDNYTKFSVAVEVEGTGASTMIKAYQKDETLNNKAPQVILVPGTWQWPTESTPINEAYPQFTKWVENNNYVAWPTPVAGKTVTR